MHTVQYLHSLLFQSTCHEVVANNVHVAHARRVRGEAALGDGVHVGAQTVDQAEAARGGAAGCLE